MTPKKKAYRKLADTMIQNLRKRNMEGFYCEDRDAARELAMEMMKEGGTVGFGGSVTLDETGILKAVEEKEGMTLIARRQAKTPEENREVFFQHVASDSFLMST